MTADPSRRPRLLAATAMASAPLVALIIARLAWADSLPPTVASHWSGSTADGFSNTATFFSIALALAAICAIGAVVAASVSTRRPDVVMWLPIGTIVSATATSTWILSVITTKAAGDPHEATLGWWFLLPLLAMLWGLAIFSVLPPTSGVGRPADAPTLDQPLLPGERAVWFGHLRSIWAVCVAGATLVGAIVSALFGDLVLTLTLTLAAIVVGALSTVTVQVSQAGFVLSSWGVHWKRIPLAKIASATAETLRPAEWGGWGYRMTGRGSAMIVRGGDGLVLALANGRYFAVSVDQPNEGARLVNSLLVRQS